MAAGDAAAKGGTPVDVAAAPDGVWVTPGAERRPVLRLDPSSGGPVGRIRAGRLPAHLAVGFGSLWITGREGRNLHRVGHRGAPHPPTRPIRGPVVARVRLPFPARSIVAGAGAVWVSSFDRGHKGVVTRIDPATNRVTGRFHVDRGGAPTLATGHGSLWLSMRRLVRIDGATRRIAARVVLPGHPGAVAAGSDALWVVVGGRPGRLARIDPRTSRVTGVTIVGFNPTAVAVDRRDGWLVSPCGPPLCDVDRGFLTRFDPATGRARGASVPLTRGPEALALDARAVWVAYSGAGRGGIDLTRVDRRTGEARYIAL